MSSVMSTKCNFPLLLRSVSRPTIKIFARRTKGNNRSTDLVVAGSFMGSFPGAPASWRQVAQTRNTPARCRRSRGFSRDLHFDLVTFDLRAVQFGDDAIGMFRGNVHKQMPLAHVHRADHFSGQAGLSRD